MLHSFTTNGHQCPLLTILLLPCSWAWDSHLLWCIRQHCMSMAPFCDLIHSLSLFCWMVTDFTFTSEGNRSVWIQIDRLASGMAFSRFLVMLYLLDGGEFHIFIPVSDSCLVGVLWTSLKLLSRVLHFRFSFCLALVIISKFLKIILFCLLEHYIIFGLYWVRQ